MLPIVEADWAAPDGILAFTTTRIGGCSVAPYDSFNLGSHVDDDPAAVTANRDLLGAQLSTDKAIDWLNQIHGTAVVEALSNESIPNADAIFSRQAGAACAVLTADCLPVLLCSESGDVVAAAHAGWRGLAAGVLEATVRKMDCEPGAILAWLGPAIGPEAFEVGPEVREAFLAGADKLEQVRINRCFCPSPSRPGYFYGDLYGLAKQRLATAGVARVSGGDYCTYADSERFFSYRRDGQTGRMASLILMT
jgi:YfiH family protein